MSSALLAKLMVKPIPAQQKLVNVGIARGEPAIREMVKIATKIIDKTAKPTQDVKGIRERMMREKATVVDHSAKRAILPEEPVTMIPSEKELPGAELQLEPEVEPETAVEGETGEVTEAVKESTEETVEPAVSAPKEKTKPKPKRRLKLIVEKPKEEEEPKIPPETEEKAEEKAEEEAEKPKAKTIMIKRPRKTKKPTIAEGPATMLKIGDTPIQERLPEKQPSVLVRASSYYMNNREIFLNFISSLFSDYKAEIEAESSSASCETRQTGEFTPLAHQKLVRDYLNIYTPYRGLLLYHGLGSGKTCSSIGIAEGMKTHKQVIIMTPASLRMNYYKELKKCGDPLFRKNQFWEFVVTDKNKTLIDTISKTMLIPTAIIRKQGGAWLVNVNKDANYDSLTPEQQQQLDGQLNAMIEYKYRFINYNGLRSSHIKQLTENFTINPFDDKVVVIDEVHNFVSRIANKITKKASSSVSMSLYEYLMSAKNIKLVFLTGTPIINYPNELGIMFNMLRGYIKTFRFKLNVLSTRKVDEASMKKLLEKISAMDYIEYRANTTMLTITRNPFDFKNVFKKSVYEGVALGDESYDDDAFVKIVTSVLRKNDIDIGGVTTTLYKALPETLDDFRSYFIDPRDGFTVMNVNLLKRRILGLSSYFRSAQEQLMPSYSKTRNFHVVKIPMSDFQFGVYEEARKVEREQERKNSRKQKKGSAAGKDIYDDAVSTYRIFSRAFCNFVFPSQEIKRPMPIKGKDINDILEEDADEDLLDAATVEQRLRDPDGRYELDDANELAKANKRLFDAEYEKRIKKALAELKKRGDEFLTPLALETYSPKFLTILNSLLDEDNIGLNLIYSQFRTLEGIGILKLVLEHNGFSHFKIKKNAAGIWELDMTPEELAKPSFALYTGTEEDDEKEILRNIFNSDWNLVPNNISNALRSVAENNYLGEVVKVLMITASGAEGIDLKNVRYVHITESYWHPVRIEQVIGRARRICSHQSLPEELRTVDVYLYLMEFSEEQLSSDDALELRLRDKSKIDNQTPLTSDQAIYEIASMKESVNSKLLEAVKEAAIDCVIHSKSGAKEGIKCFTFGGVTPNKFATTPSIAQEEHDAVTEANQVTVTWKAVTLTVDGIQYALRKETGELYDIDSYKAKNPVLVGHLEMKGKKYKITWI